MSDNEEEEPVVDDAEDIGESDIHISPAFDCFYSVFVMLLLSLQ